LNRYIVAAIAAFLVAIAYVWTSTQLLGELDHKGQAALLAVSAFSFVTSLILLYDVSRSTDTQLGDLARERASLIIGLIFVCVYVPLSVGSTFFDVVKAASAVAGRGGPGG